MKPLLICFALFCAGCAKTTNSLYPEALHDANGYATASCLWAQFLGEKPHLDNQSAQAATPYIKRQADAWGDSIVQTGQLHLEALTEIARAVREEVAKGDMLWAHIDAPVNEAFVALPLRYCSEIPNQPTVRTVIERVLADDKNILPPAQ